MNYEELKARVVEVVMELQAVSEPLKEMNGQKILEKMNLSSHLSIKIKNIQNEMKKTVDQVNLIKLPK